MDGEVVRALTMLAVVLQSRSYSPRGGPETVGYHFPANVMPETYRRSDLGQLKPGDLVNLERALVLGERLGGHLLW